MRHDDSDAQTITDVPLLCRTFGLHDLHAHRVEGTAENPRMRAAQ